MTEDLDHLQASNLPWLQGCILPCVSLQGAQEEKIDKEEPTGQQSQGPWGTMDETVPLREWKQGRRRGLLHPYIAG